MWVKGAHYCCSHCCWAFIYVLFALFDLAVLICAKVSVS